ncbi:uncharacterized protein N7484_009001 [Penicillium longicatenatum]|uniref:uncharacterized protein n=1 Tax=Penicillium longicatenatum TaxID=1561947 RepID=UPI002547AC3D|nr:uncharacterized protein N7484_009001 [Penicillium longicatenatum]KAJ5635688.1 hypothetical protein N7484_009001 [Penicillium longicatenatum]KAJ5655866.1 hypothetical protein N7507_007816 [Penicillium longicatenatum]
MHFTTLVASIAALAMSVSAAPSPATPANTRYVQLRLYGEPGCSAQNLGELGVYGNYVNSCQSFGDNDVKSVSFEMAIKNCTVRVYTGDSCDVGGQDVALNTCHGGDDEIHSYEVFCSEL